MKGLLWVTLKISNKLFNMFTFDSAAVHRKFTRISIHHCVFNVNDAVQSDKNEPFCHPKVSSHDHIPWGLLVALGGKCPVRVGREPNVLCVFLISSV